MKVEIRVYRSSGGPLADSFEPGLHEKGMKIVKAVHYPDGALHSMYRLEFATGEWVMKNPDGTWPPNTIWDIGSQQRSCQICGAPG